MEDGLRARRDRVLARPDLKGRRLAAELASITDGWLGELFAAAGGEGARDTALVAVGGYGRGELAPGSDLDLVLVHRNRRDIAAVADALWYPIWDTGVRLDHSVRTAREIGAAMDADLRVALGLLDARTVAGSAALGEEIRQAARDKWAARLPKWLPGLRAGIDERHRAAGDLAFLLEPDLKESRGGLRDAHLLGALGLADGRLEGPVAVLTDARVELQRLTGRASDRLALQFQDAVAAALGTDADTLMASLAAAGQTVAWAGDEGWRRLEPGGPRRRRGQWVADPIEAGLVVRDGAVTLAYGAEPAGDATLALRAAAASAELGLPLAASLVESLPGSPQLDGPWSPALRQALLRLLGAGPAAIPPWETLDQQGVVVRLLPEWAAVRHRPQRNAFHRWTVDRHLLETAAHAAPQTRRVDRPDLLLLAALLHDIGKGSPGDHTDAGVALVGSLGPRLGLTDDDTATLATLVRNHLLLPETATRRDLDDPATARAVADAVGDRETLHLLAALWEADARATGPAAWSPWKAGLVAALVERADAFLAGQPPPEPPEPTPEQQRLLAAGELAVRLDGHQLTVAAPATTDILATVAGALAAEGASVRSAVTRASDDRLALLVLEVDGLRDPDPVRSALAGGVDLRAAVADRERRRPPRRPDAAHLSDEVVVRVDHTASAGSVLIEVRAPDRPGTLWRIATALAGAGATVMTGIIATLGAEVIDTFYLARPAPADDVLRAAITDALAGTSRG